jgi:tripartite-type tricarboxylate transporter receptor subunit TctC
VLSRLDASHNFFDHTAAVRGEIRYGKRNAEEMNMINKRKLFTVGVAVVCMLCSGNTLLQAADQKYPSKMVSIVCPTAAGGNLDLVARTMAQALTKSLGQQFIVDNRPSFASLVGTQYVKRAVPDGYMSTVFSK